MNNKIIQNNEPINKEQYIQLNCDNCIHDVNKDTEPQCKTLNKIIETNIIESIECKLYKKVYNKK